MRYDDRKLRAQVREETLRDVADWAVALKEAGWQREVLGSCELVPGWITMADVADYCTGLADECRLIPAPTEDDGFTTVHPPVWPAIDGGLDG